MAGSGRVESRATAVKETSPGHQASLRAGVIGLGVGERHILGYEGDSRCEVVSLCDLNRERLQEVGQKHPGKSLTTSPQEILSDPEIDVVSIASFDDAHRDQVISALEHGKHVFVEKPLCLSRPELDDIAEALRKRPELQLSSNFVLRSVPRFAELRRRIKAGDLGQIYYAEGDYDYGRLQKLTHGWRGRIQNYSVVHGGGIHLIDLLLWLTGAVVQEVFAYGNQISTEGSQFAGDDMVVSVLKFTNGQVAKVASNFASVTPHHHNVSIYGTQGTFTQSPVGASYFWSRDRDAAPERLVDAYPGAGRQDMLMSFVRSILDGTSPGVSSEEVFRAMDISLAISESLVSGSPVAINNEEWWSV